MHLKSFSQLIMFDIVVTFIIKTIIIIINVFMLRIIIILGSKFAHLWVL